MSIYSFRQRRTIILVILMIVGFLLFFALKELIGSLLGAVILYTIFRKPFLHFLHKKKINRKLLVIGVIIISLLVLILPFFWVISLLVGHITDVAAHPEKIIQTVMQINNYLSENLKAPQLKANMLEKISTSLVVLIPNLINSIFSIIISIGIMYIMLFFMLMNYENFERTLEKYLPFTSSDNDIFLAELQNQTYANVLGQLFISAVQSGLIILGFILFKIPEPVFWGVISFFVSFLPLVGTPLVFVPAGLYMLAEGQSLSGWGIIIYGLVIIVNIDNFLRMYIGRRLGNIHPLITILGVIAGVPYFGVLGLVFGPLLLSYLLILIQVYEKNFSETRKN